MTYAPHPDAPPMWEHQRRELAISAHLQERALSACLGSSPIVNFYRFWAGDQPPRRSDGIFLISVLLRQPRCCVPGLVGRDEGDFAVKRGPYKRRNAKRDATIIERHQKGEDPKSIATEYNISWSRVMQILAAAAFERGAICEECGGTLRGKQTRFCGRRCAALNMTKIITNNPEFAKKVSLAKKGKPNKYKGLHYSEQGKRNIALAALARRGRPSPSKGKKTGKPAWNRGVPCKEETKQKLSNIHKSRGYGGWGESGNGRPLPKEHQALLDALSPFGWVAEYAVSLITKQPGYPTCYKVDLALVDRKFAIEIDGVSHRRREHLDVKKDAKLSSLGWVVVRVSSEEASRLAGINPSTILSDLFNV